MFETKIIQVQNDPQVLNNVNEVWGSFGWSVMNVQVVHSQNTKTYSPASFYFTGEHVVETTTINYATVTYQRDKDMENYDEIVRLEKAFNAKLEELDAASIKYKSDHLVKALIKAMIVEAIAMAIGGAIAGSNGTVVGSYVGFFGYVIYYVSRVIRNVKKNRELKICCEECEKNLDELLEKVKQLT